MIDLRSDTVTKPTPAMRDAIARAPVGDDVIDVDPTLQQLEQLTAELLGKERAIFMPSGTMTNQVAVRIHCKPGDEFLCEEGCHIYNYEQAAFAQLSGVAVRTVAGDRGVLRHGQLTGLIRPDNEHMARTRLVAIENTHNRGGGRIQPYDEVGRICDWAHQHGLRTHLDGARLMNAVVASGISAAQWAAPFDTVSLCFSKGLGAPVGSALAGSHAAIAEARRHRKAFGGGMRQAGILAAAALFALEHHVDRLAEDHANAKLLAAAVGKNLHLQLSGDDANDTDKCNVDTNIVIFDVAPQVGTAAQVADWLKARGVLLLAMGPQTIRAVTHLDVSREQVVLACRSIEEISVDAIARHASP